MATIGRVPEFEAAKEDFDSYLERFERWLAANEIKDEKIADLFLSVLGPTEYGLLKGLIEPMKAVELTETLSRDFKHKPILIAEHFRFYQRHQSQRETVADYILALKRLASTCEFAQFLDDALRDKFVFGVTGEAYHRRLLSEKDLTFKKACDIALGLKLAHRDTIEVLGHAEHQKGGHKVSDTRGGEGSQKSHFSQSCPQGYTRKSSCWRLIRIVG